MSRKHRHTTRKPLSRRVMGWSLNALILAITLVCLAWLAPSAFGYSRYVITGGSMSGTIEKGSVVFEKPVGVDDLEVGDVITYQPPAGAGTTSLVTHRIVAMEPAEGGEVLFTTQGDANPDPDPWHFKLVDQDQPVVQFHVPHAGWAFIALADRQVRIALIGGPAALIALLALGQLLSGLRRSDDDSDDDRDGDQDDAVDGATDEQAGAPAAELPALQPA